MIKDNKIDDMIQDINRVIIIGTGKLPCFCAQSCRKYDTTVYEYGAYSLSTLGVWCKKNGVTYSSKNSDELHDILFFVKEKTLIVSANSTYIIPADIINKEEILAVNFHPSLLPKHPGRNAEAWSIYERDEISGVTWHIISDGIDQGSIITQETIKLHPQITSLELMMSQFVVGAKCFSGFVDEVMERGIEGVELKENKTKECDLHYSYEIPNKGNLDVKWDVNKISAFLRAMDYGSLNVLGRPYCLLGTERFEWDRYRIEQKDSDRMTDVNSGIFSDEDNVIILEGWKKTQSME